MSVLPVGFGSQGGAGYTIENSLRFRSSASANLNRTFGTPTDQNKWSLSLWVKRGKLGLTTILGQDYVGSAEALIRFTSADTLEFQQYSSGGAVQVTNLVTTQVFRDPSAWYHFVFIFDSAGSGNDRQQIWVNNQRITSFTTGTISSNNSVINAAGRAHYLGKRTSNFFDGYMTEINFVDGQALAPSDFGEYNEDTGVWQPVAYAGTYGSNGFYLPMKLDNTTEGFNTVTYEGNGSTQQVNGVGFSPDLVWIKNRDNATSHSLYDTIRGADVTLRTNTTDQDFDYGNTLLSFNTDGFTVGDYSHVNANNESLVAWCWDAGDTTVSNDAGSITSSVRANPTYGFSVVTWAGTSTNASTIGHGLGVAPKIIITKSRTNPTSWVVGVGGISGLGVNDYLTLNTTNTKNSSSTFYQAYGSSTFTVGVSAANEMNKTGNNYVSYCFSEVAGYSKFGTYQNNNSTTGVTVTTGFRPAFIMLKCTDAGERWFILDNTRQVNNVAPPSTAWLVPNATSTEGANGATTATIDFLDDGFQIKTTNPASGEVSFGTRNYIYMAFADTREYAFWLDDSGNNNDWQPNGGITTQSTVTDTPTPYADGGNYAVLNPAIRQYSTVDFASEGNLKYQVGANGGATDVIFATMPMTSGKWFAEVQIVTTATGQWIGVCSNVTAAGLGLYGAGVRNPGYAYRVSTGNKCNNSNTGTAYAASSTTGDIIGIAMDADAGSITFYKNGVSLGVAFTGMINSGDGWLFGADSDPNGSFRFNFGQRPFAYTPPTGFLPLHTGNLPDSAIVNGSTAFNVDTYAGTGATNARTIGFQPDFVWIKSRTNAYWHKLFDSVRGANKPLVSNDTTKELTETTGLMSFDSDGFTLGTSADSTVNNSGSGQTFVAWNWKAGTAFSNDAGTNGATIASVGSVNQDAGFSISTHEAQAGTYSFYHGLGVAPSMFVFKNMDATSNWVYWQNDIALPPTTKVIYFNSTSAVGASGSNWLQSVTPNVIELTAGQVHGTSGTYVAYAFAEVEGYSKLGKYVGNNSVDGPVVYLGFRPAFLIIRSTSGLRDWLLWDTARGTANGVGVIDGALQPNTPGTPYTGSGYEGIDLLSNGFKWRNNFSPNYNTTETYIYMAFAENPFKNSLAR